MTLRKQLEALSEKATGGEWIAHPIKGYAVDEIFARNANGDADCICAEGASGYRDAPFITALVNAWRDGQLVTRDEHDRVREELRRQTSLANDHFRNARRLSERAALNGSN